MTEILNDFIDDDFNKKVVRVNSDFHMGRAHLEPWLNHHANEANKVLLDGILEYLNSDHWTCKFPQVFIKVAIKTEITDEIEEKRTIMIAPFATWPYPDWGTSCYHLNTYSGDISLLWVLPMVESVEDIKQYCVETNPASTPEMRTSIRRAINGTLKEGADAYNNNHPYQDMIDKMMPKGF